MVAAEGDDAGQSFAVLSRPFLLRIRGRGAAEDRVVSFFDLLEGIGVIVARIQMLLSAISLIGDDA